jgi:hypothetical protein
MAKVMGFFRDSYASSWLSGPMYRLNPTLIDPAGTILLQKLQAVTLDIHVYDCLTLHVYMFSYIVATRNQTSQRENNHAFLSPS